jgi:hypothetical protein
MYVCRLWLLFSGMSSKSDTSCMNQSSCRALTMKRRWTMLNRKDIKEKTKRVYEVLPKLDDQRCGYRSCGQFARAVAEGKAPCYGCVSGGSEVAAKVCEIIGARVPEVAIPQFAPSPGFYQPELSGGRGMGRGMGRGLRRGRGMGPGQGMGCGGGMGRVLAEVGVEEEERG